MNIQTVPDANQTLPEGFQALVNESREILRQASDAKNCGDMPLAISKATTALAVIDNLTQVLAREAPDLAAMFVLAQQGRQSITTTEVKQTEGHSRHTKGFLCFQIAENRTNYETTTYTRKIEVK